MTQLATCEHTETQTQTMQTLCLVVDGNSHASELLQDALPHHGMLVSEALLPQIRLVAMMIAASRLDFSNSTPEQITEEADWFAARMLVLGVNQFHLDVSLLPMLHRANQRAAHFAKLHGLVFQEASMKMSLHAGRASNVLLMEVAADTLSVDLGLVANSLALKQQVSLQSGFCNLM